MNSKTIILILLVIIASGCTTDKQLLVIGHRGAMGHETENTLASIQKALDLGVDMVEIDVLQCRSKEIVVFHDKKIDRLTNGEGFIEDLSIVTIKNLTVNGGHRIPLLQDVLKHVARKCIINIELKGKNTPDRVNYILTYYIEKNGWKPPDFLISSFDETLLREFYALNKEIPIGILTREDPLEAVALARELNAVSVHAHYEKLTGENVKALQKEGFKVYAGVVNEPSDIQKMKGLGVDGIFSDFPDRVR